MSTLFTLLPDEMCKKYNIEVMYLFGSQATARMNSESDYDIALFVSNKRKAPFIEILAEIQKISQFPDKLDLVVVDFIYSTPLLLFEITKGKVLYEKEAGRAAQLKSRAMHIYYDDEHRRKLKYEYIRREYANK